MGLGEMSQLQRGEVKTAETLDELREYYLRVCTKLYGERLLTERAYQFFDTLAAGGLRSDYSGIKSPRRDDFMKLTIEELSAEIEKVETDYRELLATREMMEKDATALIQSYKEEAELPDASSRYVTASNRRSSR